MILSLAGVGSEPSFLPSIQAWLHKTPGTVLTFTGRHASRAHFSDNVGGTRTKSALPQQVKSLKLLEFNVQASKPQQPAETCAVKYVRAWTYLPACLPTCPPTPYLPTYRPACLTAYRPARLLHVCVHASMWVCIYIYIHIHIHVYMYVCIYIYMYVYLCACAHAFAQLPHWTTAYVCT